MVDSAVYFDLPSDTRGSKATEGELKNLSVAFRESMRRRGLSVSEVFGSSTDLWGFSVDFGKHEILFSVSPNQLSKPQRWFADVLLDDPGWFKATRESRFEQMKLVERAVHSVLTTDLRARNVEWFLGKGRIDQREGRPEP